METIPKNSCTKIGFIRKTHGVKGELILEFEPVYEESIAETERFFLELDRLLVPFFLDDDGFRFKTGNTAIIRFKWTDNEKLAKSLVGSPVYLFNEEIIDEDSFTWQSQFMGYIISDKNSGNLGPVIRADDFSGNIVLTITYQNRELLIPYSDDFLISTDEKNKIINLDLPEGLLESGEI